MSKKKTPKNLGGRPAVAESEKLKPVTVMLNQGQKARVAAAAGKNISGWARDVLLAAAPELS